MECFPKYLDSLELNIEDESTQDRNRVLTKFFNLKNTYLSFMDYNEDNNDNGVNDDDTLIINSTTGKTKVSIQDYVKNLKILDPDVAVMPFEYVNYKG